MSGGDLMTFLERPISLTFIIIALFVLLSSIVPWLSKRRAVVETLEDRQ
jgi:TctA family transporter